MRVPPLVAAFAYLAVTCVLLVACQPDRYADVKQRYPSFRVYPDTVYGPMSRWSPDGTEIISHLLGGLAISNPDGSDKVFITDHGRTPDWSPDGKKIAFAYWGSESQNIYTMNVDGTGEVQLTHLGFSGTPRWSPDGKRITFFRSLEDEKVARSFVMDADGNNIVQLIHDPIFADTALEWSPDGTRIAFGAHDSSPRPEGQPTPIFDNRPRWLYTIKPDGSDLRLVEKATLSVGSPTWSPDGQYLLFEGYPVGLYLAKADGSEMHQIMEGFYCIDPNWSRQNNHLICFCMHGNSIGNLCSVDMGEVLSK